MTLSKKGEYCYGDSQQDIQTVLAEYANNAYPIAHVADAHCSCGKSTFQLLLDDVEGVAVRTCTTCKLEHAIGDSGEWLAEAELVGIECLCGSESFEITIGVALYGGLKM